MRVACRNDHLSAIPFEIDANLNFMYCLVGCKLYAIKVTTRLLAENSESHQSTAYFSLLISGLTIACDMQIVFDFQKTIL